MTDSWYDVLGVEPTASEAEIKGAWRSLVTVLGPTDHRFAAINEAASVLLDADKRAAYDADVLGAPVAAEPEPPAAAEPEGSVQAVEAAEAAPDAEAGESVAAEAAPDQPSRPKASARTLVDVVSSPWVATVAAVLAVVLLAATGVLYLLQDDGSKISERSVTISLTDAKLTPIKQQVSTRETADITAALQAAVAAAPKALAYDYRTLAKNEADAKAVMTAKYAASSFTPYFDGLVKTNAPRLKQVVVCGPVLDAGVVRTAPNVVEVLLFVDRFASNSSASGVSQDFADVTMVNENGTWLISNFGTAPIPQ